MDEIITLDYGSGGKKTSRLIENMIVPALANPALSELGDGAVIPGADKLVFSTTVSLSTRYSSPAAASESYPSAAR